MILYKSYLKKNISSDEDILIWSEEISIGLKY